MLKLGVIFGGMSTEHNVSVVSGTAVIENLDKNKYDILPIYIDKEGNWHKYTKSVDKIKTLNIKDKITEVEKIENIVETLKNLDCIFPVLHGLYGEDGTIQGLFELIKIPYVGCGVLSSSIAMDKVYSKIIFEKAELNQAKYEYIKKENDKLIYVDKKFNEKQISIEEICKMVENDIKFPVFVKPSNSGSSVGVNKVENSEDLSKAINDAFKYDNKVLIEEQIVGKEIECAVLGNDIVEASVLGEVLSAENYYSFNSKYNNKKSKTQIPANLPEEISNKIRKLAIKAYKAIAGRGLSRVDFFVQEKTNKIYINEINTLPGFTQISMYPKLFEKLGISYSELLDKLINLSL